MVKQRIRKKATPMKAALPPLVKKRLGEGVFILVLTMALFSLLALWTYHLADPGWSTTTSAKALVHNAGGVAGAYCANTLFWAFGYWAYVLPLSVMGIAWMILTEQRDSRPVNISVLYIRCAGFWFLLLGGCGLLSLNVSLNAFSGHFSAGGALGQSVAMSLKQVAHVEGANLILFAIMLSGMTWATHLSWGCLIEGTGAFSILSCQWTARFLLKGFQRTLQMVQSFENIGSADTPTVARELPRVMPQAEFHQAAPPLVKVEKIEPHVPDLPPSVITFPSRNVPKTVEPPKMKAVGGLPALRLLDKAQPGKPMGGFTHQELEIVSREVEQHLRDFGVMADVVAVHPGPVITRFELQLAAGVKVSKLSALSVDLARSLSVKSVRVVEIIPGKTVVGIELPNQHRGMVTLSEVLSSDVYQQAQSPLTMALGVDIAGHPMIVDLGKMPHLLVAGTTGSGKSVGINAMILSLLFKASPEQVRLIMIDPKMLELSVYEGIPHLLTPVVTDMKEAASALRWCVGEMERRYRLMSSLGVRNLAGFNTKLTEAIANGTPIRDPLWKPIHGMDLQAPELQTLPYVVVIIDELADMMMVVGKKVEQLIARIAQKARAAGIHLILATQRPSVDVLTGLIKSNIPTRISFQVSSKIDSRTILDQQGAEQLLGHGDMLFLAPGTGAPLRVHGAFVDDKEVHRVADDWRARGRPEYLIEITQSSGEGSDFGIDGDEEETEDSDPLYDQAVEFVIQTRKASISSVQRRFKIGYNRAARLVEEMERTGLVGPLDGGSRDVLTSAIAQD